MKPLALLRVLTVLCVENEPLQRVLIGDLLDDFFHAVLLADNGTEALRLFAAQPVHVLITALKMPGIDGLELIERIRREDRDLPILVISASTETADLLVAARLRLTDYLVKPLVPARLREALQRCALDLLAAGQHVVQLDAHLSYCQADGSLRRGGETLPLTGRERALLELLLKHRDQWLSSERLIGVLYAGSERGGAESLKSLVLRLRRKLGAALIVNRYGVGYRLVHSQPARSRAGTEPRGG